MKKGIKTENIDAMKSEFNFDCLESVIGLLMDLKFLIGIYNDLFYCLGQKC